MQGVNTAKWFKPKMVPYLLTQTCYKKSIIFYTHLVITLKLCISRYPKQSPDEAHGTLEGYSVPHLMVLYIFRHVYVLWIVLEYDG